MPLSVFISYAREDREAATKIYRLLENEGMSPWIDYLHVLPGQNWEVEIERALAEANVIVLVMSSRSVSKRGFVQREANEAIDRLKYKLPTDIYVLPMLLEPCDVPPHIAGRLQFVDLNEPNSWDKIRAALRISAKQQSIELQEGSQAGRFRVFTERFEEVWQGAPGHDIRIEYPRFESNGFERDASELSLYFGGRAAASLIHSRQNIWRQSPDLFPDPTALSSMDGRWESFGVVFSTDELLSLTVDVGWYGAGAAHPNSFFETYNFSLLERPRLLRLDEDFFVNSSAALELISDRCIAQLTREFWERTGEQPDEDQLRWFHDGAGAKFENFSAFNVGADGFTFLFAPYQVSAYAFGRWSVEVSYFDLLHILKPNAPIPARGRAN